ncbi:hypothetical protein SAMN05216371_0273 [Streptomyces sp. TLI_053]|nr:hypothetical protein SAMN05216371_0273 [Streptomyces sp. TLI_053]
MEVSAGAHEHSGGSGEQEGRSGGSRLWAVGRIVVAVGLAAGLTVAVVGLGWASAWLVYHWAPYRLVHVVDVIVLLVLLLLGIAAAVAGTRRPWRLSVVSLTVFSAGWLFLELCCVFMAGRQALHDRGEPVPAVVVEVSEGHWQSSTFAEVRLADGTRHANVPVGDEHPRPGDRITVTLDPEGLAQPRLGPPPGPPGTTWRNVSLAATAVGAAGLGTHLAGRQGPVLFRSPRPPEDTPRPGYRRRPARPRRRLRKP